MSEVKRQITGYRNRSNGKAFEDLIVQSCNYYLNRGEAYIQKTPEPMRPISRPNNRGQFTAVFEKKAQPDFKGVVRSGQMVVFEAKYTDARTIRRNAVTEAQMTDLIRYQQLGAQAFVFVSFGFRGFYLIPVKRWYYMKELYGQNELAPEDVAEYEVEFKGGVLHFLERKVQTNATA